MISNSIGDCSKLAKMKALLNTLNKELLKAQKNVQKIETKHYWSRTEKNDFFGDDKIWKQFAKAVEIRDFLSTTIENISKLG